MQTRLCALRPSCSSQNAYSPTEALRAAFSELKTTSVFRGPYDRTRSERDSSAEVAGQNRYVSTISAAMQEGGQATMRNNGTSGEDKEKLGLGGTFGNYEALKDSFGTSRRGTQHIRLVNTKRSGVAPQPLQAVDLRDRQKALEESIQVRRTNTNPSGDTADIPQQVKRRKPKPRGTKPAAQVPQTVPNGETGKTYETIRTDGQDSILWKKRMHRIARHAVDLAQRPVDLSDKETINARQEELNYSAVSIQPAKNSNDRGTPIPWASNLAQESSANSTQLLEQEVKRFVEYMDLTLAERAARNAIIADTTAFIAKHMGSQVQSELFGSETTGLATATSDIDIRVSFVTTYGSGAPSHLARRMNALATAMMANSEYICVTFRHAKFPIISAQHKKSGIDIQIVSAPATTGQHNLTLRYLTELPHLQTLYTLFREALCIRGLLDVFNGGTGSYGLFIMIVASLERRSKHPIGTITDQLLHFMDFYSGFAAEKYGISVSPPKLFKKHDADEVPTIAYANAARRRGDPVRAAQWAIGQRRLYQPYLLCLQDPANPENDLGRKSNAIKHVQKTLGHIRNSLRESMGNAAAISATDRQKGSYSLLQPLVGRCHELYYERRKKVEEYGVEMMKRQKIESEPISEPVEPTPLVVEDVA